MSAARQRLNQRHNNAKQRLNQRHPSHHAGPKVVSDTAQLEADIREGSVAMAIAFDCGCDELCLRSLTAEHIIHLRMEAGGPRRRNTANQTDAQALKSAVTNGKLPRNEKTVPLPGDADGQHCWPVCKHA